MTSGIGRSPSPAQRATAYASFSIMGLGGGLLSVALPSLVSELGQGYGAAGAMFACESFGYIMYTLPSASLLARLGLGPILVIGALARTAGFVGYSFAESWSTILASALLGGIGTGAIDAGMNTYYAGRCGPAETARLHASCGLGAIIGPAAMAALQSGGLSWRTGYSVMAIAQLLTALGLRATIARWSAGSPGSARQHKSGDRHHPSSQSAISSPAIWMVVALFFVATGLEAATGQWSYVMLSEAHGIAPTMAGSWTSLYFGCLVAGRILVSSFVGQLGSQRTLRMATLCALGGAVLLSLGNPSSLSIIGLALLGLSVGPVFSLLVAQTRSWVGPALTHHAIGLGMTSAVLGIAVVQAAAGIVAETIGVAFIGPLLASVALLLLASHELAVWLRRPGRDT